MQVVPTLPCPSETTIHVAERISTMSTVTWYVPTSGQINREDRGEREEGRDRGREKEKRRQILGRRGEGQKKE